MPASRTHEADSGPAVTWCMLPDWADDTFECPEVPEVSGFRGGPVHDPVHVPARRARPTVTFC
jgi:hypothetical protein